MVEATTPVAKLAERKRHHFLVDMVIRLVKEKPLGTFGGIVVLLLFAVGISADLLAPYGYNEIDLPARLSAPSLTHILGCDNLGRDLLSRIIYGARISMIVSVVCTFISITGHLVLGTVSGYFGGKTDLVIQRMNDTVQCIPSLLIILSVMTIVGPGMTQVILVMGIHSALLSRGVRSYVIAIRESMYFDAARAIGASNFRILAKHVTPNIMPFIIISFSMSMGRFILAEATLSFLGFGIPPPIPSWGGMISGPGRQYLLLAPWMAVWPGVALAIVVYGINMLGDGLRDILDPRMRGGLGRYGGVEAKRVKMAAKAGVIDVTAQK